MTLNKHVLLMEFRLLKFLRKMWRKKEKVQDLILLVLGGE